MIKTLVLTTFYAIWWVYMPFLCEFSKASVQQRERVNNEQLTGLLCPYRGSLSLQSIGHARIRLSSIGAESNTGELIEIPGDTRRSPHTAWVAIQLTSDGVEFTTDPMGTFPLWVYEDENQLLVTGEVKSLKAVSGVQVQLKQDLVATQNDKRPANFSPYLNVRRVQPGAVLVITHNLKVIEKGGLPLTYMPEAFYTEQSQAKTDLAQALESSADSVPKREGGWGTFLSGGIDSSTATALLSKRKANLSTYTLGTEFGDEYADARDLADYLQLEHSEVFADESQAVDCFKRAIFCNEVVDGLTAETLAQLIILSSAASEKNRNIVTGYGADLLFGSMLRHELYMKVTGVDDLQSLIERTCWSGEFSPFFAWSLGVEVHHLFWDPNLMNTAFRIPVEWNFDGAREKVLMRETVVENGWMEHEHAFRKKHAMTDGTQFNRVLSSALNLSDNYSYGEKTEHAVAELTRIFNL